MKKQQLHSNNPTSSRGCASCSSVKESLVDLFVNVRIRNDQSMHELTPEKLDREKAELRKQDSTELIDCIKESIEALISMKMDED